MTRIAPLRVLYGVLCARLRELAPPTTLDLKSSACAGWVVLLRKTPSRLCLRVRTACRTPAHCYACLGALPPRLRRPFHGAARAGKRLPHVAQPYELVTTADPPPPAALQRSWPPWRVVFRKPLARPLSGSGALGFAPQTAFRTHSLKLGIASENCLAPPTRPAAWTSGWRPRLTGLLADLSLRSKLVGQAPSSGTPGMLPAGPGQLPATPGQGQGYRLRPPGGGQAPGSARQPRYAACLPSSMRLLNKAAQRI